MHQKLVAFIGALFCGVAVSNANLVTRQPGPFAEGMDTWYGNVYNTTAVHDNKLRVGGWSDIYVSMLRFDLSGLPQTATQAILYLYIMPPGDGSTTTPMTWYLISSQWHSGTIGWATSLSGSNIGSTSAPGSSPGWYGVNITSYYNSWRTGNASTLNYGFQLAPWYNNNRFNVFHSSSSSLTGARPLLYVYYTPQANDNVLKLKWPLGGASSPLVTQGFGVDWSTGATCNGLLKKHNGVDYAASAGTAVYAAEDGIVKEVHYDSSGLWAYNIVLEHNHPQGGKYTTVYWHVNPVGDVFQSLSGGFIPKGMQIGSIADLGSNTHLHFGVRIGSYANGHFNGVPFAGTGSLPQTDCGGYPAFPAGFINPNNTSNVLFQ